ncbi:MAG TPA: bifunctional UDP-N-acetylglucosamine diphosphorylase/glucosamine-1-phosphate N-acetyltransferase GlmU [Gammaproteobacteria bacterium]|nr:bifunctional UDP-N-acetylglucosamine diphosphorylase/glucosamine-1-phosphate N-acetyltransferase GlmU [Gammaproteobacteria bacterium]
MKATGIVILAAGQGKRMCSTLPKVLHPLAGKPLLEHVLQTALRLAPTTQPLVIYGHEGERLQAALSHYPVTWIRQEQQKGTAHALLQALPQLTAYDRVFVLYGDVPLISLETLRRLQQETPAEAFGLITATLSQPFGYGRIKRDDKKQVVAIIEEKDADEKTRQISEINTGIYYLPAASLKKWLPSLSSSNAQDEYYLTDLVPLALEEKKAIHTIEPQEVEEILGVNDRVQLNYLERFYQERYAQKLMRQGVTLYDPKRLDVRGELIVGPDVVIDVNVVIEGRVVLGKGCIIGPQVYLRNAVLGERVEIKANSVIDGAEIAADCIVGPFARLRPGTVLATKAHIGNFVEIKNSLIDEDTKVNHLSYIGDAEIGKRVNIGAGTITCNYDGLNKNKTWIGDDAFIGSGTELVAPLLIGEGATIGAGSTITKDAPPQQLTLERTKQQSNADWQRPVKIKEKE